MLSYSMDPQRWARELTGEGCPFCAPREAENGFWSHVAKLSHSSLLLSRDQRYEGRCLLIWDGAHKVGLSSLSAQEHAGMMEDLRLACMAIEKASPCDLMNVASLGNQIAHLHLHILPRRCDDARWGAPPWTTSTDDVPARRLPEPRFTALRDAIASELALITSTA